MDLHHGNNFARDFLADDGMAEVHMNICPVPEPSDSPLNK